METTKYNWKVGIFTGILFLAIIFLLYNYIYVPIDAKLLKKEIELAKAKAKLEVLEDSLHLQDARAKDQEKHSDSLYLEWEKRSKQPTNTIQYEKDINYIHNSSIEQRAKLLSDWLSAPRRAKAGDSKGK